MSQPRVLRTLLFGGITAVLVGYFAVWLPGPSAGLRLIGLELGEWIKFLGAGWGRNWFYLPPIALGGVMALLTVGWENGRWQTWLFRLLAIAISLLAFPAVAAITTEPRGEWLARVLGIAAVVALALVSSVVGGSGSARRTAWLGAAVLSALGLALPLWQCFQVRPIVSDILRQSIGLGLGVWLNSLGFLAILIVAVWTLRASNENRPSVRP